jgi:hypothetical protein
MNDQGGGTMAETFAVMQLCTHGKTCSNMQGYASAEIPL